MLLAFLSHDWAGLVIAGLIAIPAVVAWRAFHGTAARVAAGLVLFGTALLGGGATYHVVHMAQVHREYPAPGRLIDIGGYRVHVLAEGDSHGKASIVWLAGAHEAGYAHYHLHAALRGEARSILIDRPGSGWSDAGPFPRTTAREAEEVIAALRGAGERGPFVFAGHSYGGLLAANIARRHPEITSAVVLLDATPPDAINYTPPNPYFPAMRHAAALIAEQRLFGIHHDTMERLAGRDPDAEARRVGDLMSLRLGGRLREIQAVEDSSKSSLAEYSIFAELLPAGIGWDNTVYDGELGALPTYLVAPHGIPDFDQFAATMYAAGGKGPEAEFRERLRRFEDRCRERYMQVADHVERVDAPPGSSHNFIYEHVDFVLDIMRHVLRENPPRPRA